jgi:hypothetical protein
LSESLEKWVNKVGATLTWITYKKATDWWLLNSEGRSIKYFNLKSEWVYNRTNELLNIYGYTDYSIRHTIAKKQWVKTEVLVCIAWSETWIGKATKSKNNIGNVWNNDRWDTVHLDTLESGINSIAWTISHWTYMKNKSIIWDLYPSHISKPCKNDCKYVYASSKENAMNNVLNCLGMIHNKQIKSDFSYLL